jgi:hypothetical protein
MRPLLLLPSRPSALAMYWIKAHGTDHGKPRKRFALFDWLSGFHRWFNYQFEKFREGYRDRSVNWSRNWDSQVAESVVFTSDTVRLSAFAFSRSISISGHQRKAARANRRRISTDAVSDNQGVRQDFQARGPSILLSVSAGEAPFGPPLWRIHNSSKSRARIAGFP